MICPICQSNKTHPSFKAINIHGRHIISANTQTYNSCDNCKLIFHQNKRLSTFYKPNYYPAAKKNIIIKSVYYILNKISSSQRLKIINKYITKSRITVLDIGCGQMDFLKNLPNYFSKTGIDINFKANNTINIKYIQSDYLKYKFVNKFDVICLFHSIEHFIDINSLVKKIYHDLSPNGIVLITTPNTNSLGFKLGKKYWYHLDSPIHTHLFNQENLAYLLEQHQLLPISNKKVRYEYPLDLFWSTRFHLSRFIIWPFYPIFKLFSSETILAVAQKKL